MYHISWALLQALVMSVNLISEDGRMFEVSRESFRKIGIYRSASEDPDVTEFPIHAVTSNILQKVIEYLEMHESDSPAKTIASISNMVHEEDIDFCVMDDIEYTRYSALISPRDRQFLATIDLPTLIEVTKAANYLHIPDLLDLCCMAVANQMRGLSVEELRSKFNICNDFTPEEEERVQKETLWLD